MEINDAAVIAELTSCHEHYEKALIDNDVAALDGFFWDSPHALRFGVAENLHGTDEIRAFRQGRPKFNLDRNVLRLDIMSFGQTAGIVNLEFSRLMDGLEQQGRQTQFWFRFAEGWKIVSAHVSLLPLAADAVYLKAAQAKIGLKIDPAYMADVKVDLGRLSAVADFLMQFPLPQDVEAAPVFQS